MKICSFNVRGLTSEIRKVNLLKDAEKYKCDIIALQETKIQSIDINNENFRLLTFNSSCRHYGLGYIISSELNKNVQKYWSVNDRIAVIRLKYPPKEKKGKHKFISIINVYGPTSTITAKNPHLREEFYHILHETISELKNDTIFICGDFNSKIGIKASPNTEICTGSYSRNKRNENGDALIEFCLENSLFVSNSAFKHKARHITTWEGQRKDKTTNAVVKIYNQIDYVLIPQRLRPNLTDSRTFAGTLTSTDHRLLITTLNLKSNWKYQSHKISNECPIYYTEELLNVNCTETKIKFQEVCADLRNKKSPLTCSSPNNILDELNNTLLSAAEKTLPTIPKTPRHKDHCPIIETLSLKQKQLRLEIKSSKSEIVAKEKKKRRNEILHKIREKALENHNKKIDDIVSFMATCSYSAATFKAINIIRKKPTPKVVIHDENKRFVNNESEKLKILSAYVEEKYDGPNDINPFADDIAGPLLKQISISEVSNAINQLNNNKAPGIDNIQAELLKAAPDQLIEDMTYMFNLIYKKNEHLHNIGKGKLILIPKPGKPAGPPQNLRPIVLLPTARKVLSNITYNRVKEKINQYLSPSQAGFRPLRSTADIVWTHRWMVGRVERYKEEYTILGIDMSSAFDTIDREKLLDICQTFLDADEVKLIRTLLADTSLLLSFGNIKKSVKTIIGTPQGDSLSPVLFVVYLEAALRELRPKIFHSTTTSTNVRVRELIYADDVDFIFDDKDQAEEAVPIISNVLANWNLKVNQSKTEVTTVSRTSHGWKTTRKLGSLLSTEEDIKRRKLLATVAFNSLCKLWMRRNMIQKTKILQLYNALVLPILLYNCGTWSLTKKTSDSINAFHRKQLRKIMDIKWEEKISNKKLYSICKSKPITEQINKMRWSLFGHILRRDEELPAQQVMNHYFIKDKKKQQYRGRRPTNLQAVIEQELSMLNIPNKHMIDHTYFKNNQNTIEFATLDDLNNLREIAKNKEKWRDLTELIQTNTNSSKPK